MLIPRQVCKDDSSKPATQLVVKKYETNCGVSTVKWNLHALEFYERHPYQLLTVRNGEEAEL